jgi:hypothetical protein
MRALAHIIEKKSPGAGIARGASHSEVSNNDLLNESGGLLQGV